MAQATKLGFSGWIEAGHVSAGGADPEGERFPPVVEGQVLDAYLQRRGLDLTQAHRFEQLLEVPLTGAGKTGFIINRGVEYSRRIPERTERPPSAGMIPDAGRD